MVAVRAAIDQEALRGLPGMRGIPAQVLPGKRDVEVRNPSGWPLLPGFAGLVGWSTRRDNVAMTKDLRG
jgi:hypothetical protein